MLNRSYILRVSQQGTTMLEVLVTIMILAFGMLGLAGLQGKITMAEMESYQRGQAVLLLNDMVDRINANRGNAATYVTTAIIGTGDTTFCTATSCSCATLTTEVARDRCEWSKALQGAAEVSGSTGKVGAMVGALGCITPVRSEIGSPTCQPGIYQVEVAWQGLHTTAAPATALACGKNSFGDERYRRDIATAVSIGLPICE